MPLRPRLPRAPRTSRVRTVSLLLASSLLVALLPAQAAAESFPSSFGLGTLGPGSAWNLVDSGYSLADIDPLSGTNIGSTMADALTTQYALEPALMDSNLLALDTTRLAEQARLEAMARQRAAALQNGGRLRPGAVPEQYAALVEDAAASCPGLPVGVLAAQIEAESNWNPRAVSNRGAQGLAQFMPGTWAAYGGGGDPFDPAAAIAAAARYDCVLMDETKSVPGDPVSNMLAAYNAGPSRVRQYQGVPPFAETRNYVEKILARAPEMVEGGDDSAGSEPDSSLDGYSNGRIPDSALCALGRGGHKLRCDAARTFKDLDAGYRAAFGTSICLTDTYRSYDAQVRVKAAKPTLAAKPGTSNHGWGKAIDFCGGINRFGTPQHRWMQQNAGRYGWKHPSWARAGGSKPEAWHWEFG